MPFSEEEVEQIRSLLALKECFKEEMSRGSGPQRDWYDRLDSGALPWGSQLRDRGSALGAFDQTGKEIGEALSKGVSDKVEITLREIREGIDRLLASVAD